VYEFIPNLVLQNTTENNPRRKTSICDNAGMEPFSEKKPILANQTTYIVGVAGLQTLAHNQTPALSCSRASRETRSRWCDRAGGMAFVPLRRPTRELQPTAFPLSISSTSRACVSATRLCGQYVLGFLALQFARCHPASIAAGTRSRSSTRPSTLPRFSLRRQSRLDLESPVKCCVAGSRTRTPSWPIKDRRGA
jgi:hypothetical protein